MTSGWFAFTVVAGMVISTGCIVAVSLLRAAWARREREALTSADLRALEESAVYLIEQLKAEADHAMSEFEQRSSRLQVLIAEADARLASLADALASNRQAASSMLRDEPSEPLDTSLGPSVDRARILGLASTGLGCADIAKATGLGLGEVRLLIELAGREGN